MPFSSFLVDIFMVAFNKSIVNINLVRIKETERCFDFFCNNSQYHLQSVSVGCVRLIGLFFLELVGLVAIPAAASPLRNVPMLLYAKWIGWGCLWMWLKFAATEGGRGLEWNILLLRRVVNAVIRIICWFTQAADLNQSQPRPLFTI